MKYENYEKCKEIVSQIKDNELMLNELESETLHVRITNPYGNSIMTVDLMSNHEYKPDAFNFVTQVREDIAERISNLKKELIEL